MSHITIFRAGESVFLSARKYQLIFSTLLLLISILLCATVSAENLASTKEYLVAERPNASDGATLVSIGIYLLDIDYIDNVNQRFKIDFFVNYSWRDPRLSLLQERSGLIRRMPLEKIWSPSGFIVNDRGLKRHLPQLLEVDDLGNVVYRQRYTGELAVDLILKKFPFDIQRLPIEVITFDNSPDEVHFSFNPDISGDADFFSAEGWRLRSVEPKIDEFTLPAAGGAHPRFTYFIEAKREYRYYLLTMFIPMSLVVFMAWMTFWLQPSIIPSRIGISTASIFTLIALGFSIRLSLPPIPYTTRADIFVTGCTLLVFLALIVAVISSRWATDERIEEATRLNVGARWIYSGLFAVVVIISLVK